MQSKFLIFTRTSLTGSHDKCVIFFSDLTTQTYVGQIIPTRRLSGKGKTGGRVYWGRRDEQVEQVLELFFFRAVCSI